jgi:excisionase family DNA binding protein
LERVEAQLAAVLAAVETLGERLDGGSATAGAVSVEEAGRMLGVGRSTAFELIQSGDLRPIKIRSRTLVPTAQIRALLRRGTAT